MTSASTGATLREELGGAPDPDFELQLLPGWERRTPDDADQEQLEEALKRRFMDLQRPDLFAEARAMLHESHRAMQREGAIAYYVAAEGSEDTLWIPGSIIVSLRRPPTGGTLDELVRHAIREYGATPLFGDRRFIRFEREHSRKVGGETLVVSSLTYMTPVPGSKRRRALQLTASFGRPGELHRDDDKVRAIKSAFDLCVSTLRWIPRA